MKKKRYSTPYATNSFLSLAIPTRSRSTHGCGTISVQDDSGNKEVVVAGDRYDDTVDIYSIANDSWREGNIQLMMSN